MQQIIWIFVTIHSLTSSSFFFFFIFELTHTRVPNQLINIWGTFLHFCYSIFLHVKKNGNQKKHKMSRGIVSTISSNESAWNEASQLLKPRASQVCNFLYVLRKQPDKFRRAHWWIIRNMVDQISYLTCKQALTNHSEERRGPDHLTNANRISSDQITTACQKHFFFIRKLLRHIQTEYPVMRSPPHFNCIFGWIVRLMKSEQWFRLMLVRWQVQDDGSIHHMSFKRGGHLPKISSM